MSFRARPNSTRTRTWEDRDRRSMLLNIGFGVTIVAALLLLVIAAGVTWYGDHLVSAGSVNGESISKDAYNRQLAVNSFRTDYQARRLRTLLTAGHLRAADAQARQSILDQRTQQASTIALEQLIDGKIMAQLAPAQNVTVTDADIDARMTDEATTPELRNAWMIAVAPTLATGETVFTDAEKAAAKAKADQALADLKAGKDWATVAAAVSTDASKAQGGELGYIDKNAALDGTFVDAMMAVAPNTPTDVVEGADGIYRIGKVTDVIPPAVDGTLQEQVKDAGIDLADFRAAIGRDELRSKLNDAVLAGFLASGPQRKVSEISGCMRTPARAVNGAVRSPAHPVLAQRRPENASKVADTDPAWNKAPARGAGDLRQAQGRPVAVRRDRAQGERRGLRRHHRRQAPVLLDGRRHRSRVRRGDLRAGPRARPAARAGEVGRSAGT